MNTMKFRPQRRTLDEALAEMVTLPSTVEALLEHLNAKDPMLEHRIEDLRFKYVGPDQRIGWKETWYVYFEGMGVTGMVDSIPDNAPDTAFDKPPQESKPEVACRPNISHFQKSLDRMVTLPPTMEALMAHLSAISLDPVTVDLVRLTSLKADRRIDWHAHWRVEIIGRGVVAFLNGIPFDVPHTCFAQGEAPALRPEDQVVVTAHAMIPVPKGVSPYTVDSVRSGTPLSGGWDAMFESGKSVLDEVILVNFNTGQRVRLVFEPHTIKQY